MQVTKESVAETVKKYVPEGRQATVLMAFGLPPFDKPMTIREIAAKRGDGFTRNKVHYHITSSMPDLERSNIWKAFMREFEFPKRPGRNATWGIGAIAKESGRDSLRVSAEKTLKKILGKDEGGMGHEPTSDSKGLTLTEVRRLVGKAGGLTRANNALKKELAEAMESNAAWEAAFDRIKAEVRTLTTESNEASKEIRKLSGELEKMKGRDDVNLQTLSDWERGERPAPVAKESFWSRLFSW